MKLLPPSETQDLRSVEISRDILRIQEVKKLLKEEEIRLARAEADFSSMIARKQKEWAVEEENHLKEVERRKKEIEDLEAKKLNFLIPFNILKKGSDDKIFEAEKFLSSLREREQKADDLLEILEDRLDGVSERELAVKKVEDSQKLAWEGIRRQQESVKEGSGQLTQQIKDFISKKASEEKEIGERKTALVILERTLLTKQQTQKRNEKELSDWSIRLHDERQTLDAAWKELERKKNIPTKPFKK